MTVSCSGRQGDIMTVKRMDDVGVVVEDLDAAIEFSMQRTALCFAPTLRESSLACERSPA
jgi:hypothetical protein